jgi:hypothetical protein
VGSHRRSPDDCFACNYDINADGQRFVMVKDKSNATLNLVLNWFEELRRLVPVN